MLHREIKKINQILVSYYPGKITKGDDSLTRQLTIRNNYEYMYVKNYLQRKYKLTFYQSKPVLSIPSKTTYFTLKNLFVKKSNYYYDQFKVKLFSKTKIVYKILLNFYDGSVCTLKVQPIFQHISYIFHYILRVRGFFFLSFFYTLHLCTFILNHVFLNKSFIYFVTIYKILFSQTDKKN